MSGSPPVISTSGVPISATRSRIWSSVMRSPPWNAYSVSHHTQRSGQPVSRTNVQGSPAQVLSPWTEWKISVTRRKSVAGAFSFIGESNPGGWATFRYPGPAPLPRARAGAALLLRPSTRAGARELLNCGRGRGRPLLSPHRPGVRPTHPATRAGELRVNCGRGRSRRAAFRGASPVRVRVRLRVPVPGRLAPESEPGARARIQRSEHADPGADAQREIMHDMLAADDPRCRRSARPRAAAAVRAQCLDDAREVLDAKDE